MDEDKVIEELGSIKTAIRGVEKRLDSGSKKMDMLLEKSIEAGERITAVESTCKEKHSDCESIHTAITAGCIATKANEQVMDKFHEGGKGKLNITFDQLMKLIGFVALVATCGMVAWQTGVN